MTKGKLILCQGLPASGKTTWAKEFCKSDPSYVRVNKDDIRIYLHGGIYSKENEKEVVSFERTRVKALMAEGKNVIVDNTHLINKRVGSNQHVEYYGKLAEENGYEVEVKEFFITKEEAIERDLLRIDKKPVGEEVIRRMVKHSRIPSKFPANPVFLPIDGELYGSVICDLDGTLAFMNGKRSPYDYSKVGGDGVNDFLQHILCALKLSGLQIIFVSGRRDECREETIKWIKEKANIIINKDTPLYMRASSDTRCDTIVKKEIYEEHIKGKSNVIAVFDDRNRVVDMWRELGLPTYQVWYGDF